MTEEESLRKGHQRRPKGVTCVQKEGRCPGHKEQAEVMNKGVRGLGDV